MLTNSIRHRLLDGETTVGTLQILDSAMVSEMIGVAGMDFVVYDQEHGPYDLSQSLGIPGQVTHDRVEELMRHVCDRAAETDTVVGAFADSTEIANKWIDAGVQYVAIGVEAALFTQSLAGIVGGIDHPSQN